MDSYRLEAITRHKPRRVQRQNKTSANHWSIYQVQAQIHDKRRRHKAAATNHYAFNCHTHLPVSSYRCHQLTPDVANTKY